MSISNSKEMFVLDFEGISLTSHDVFALWFSLKHFYFLHHMAFSSGEILFPKEKPNSSLNMVITSFWGVPDIMIIHRFFVLFCICFVSLSGTNPQYWSS